MRLLLATIFSLLVIPVMAAEWQGPDDVLQAAKTGNPEAQLEMGILYEYGFHMPGNNVPALAWYLVSAEQGNQSAAQRSDILQQKMLPTEVEEGRQLSQNLSSLADISSNTTSTLSHIPMPEQPMEQSPDQVPEQSPEQGQGEVSQEAMPEPLPELGPEPAP